MRFYIIVVPPFLQTLILKYNLDADAVKSKITGETELEIDYWKAIIELPPMAAYIKDVVKSGGTLVRYVFL